MSTSSLTIKEQTTIPVDVLKALNLKPGDKIMFEVKDHQAILKKIEPFDYQYHANLSVTLTEWATAEDEEVYGKL